MLPATGALRQGQNLTASDQDLVYHETRCSFLQGDHIIPVSNSESSSIFLIAAQGFSKVA